MEKNVRAFDNAISWIEVARKSFDALGQIVKDVAKALDITDIQDFDKALETVLRPRDLAEWDNRIWGLQKEKTSDVKSSSASIGPC